MATASQNLTFAIRAMNEASRALKDASSDIEGVEKKASAADRALDGMRGAANKAKDALSDMGKVAGGFILANVVMKTPGILMDAAKAAAEDEAATLRLNKALENYVLSTGGAAEETQELIDDMNERITAGQKLAFTDDQVRDSMQFLLAATGDYGEATKRSTAAMDLARGANIDLGLATKMLGKMNEDNVEVFKKLGITLGENATEADALAAVQAKFGGQAEAYAKSTAGQFEQTKIRMGELKEQIGTALLPAMTAIGNVLVTQVIPKLEEFAGYWAANVQPKVTAFIGWVKPQLQEIGEFIRDKVMPEVKKQFEKFQEYYESDIRPAIANIKKAIESVVSFLKEHWGQIEPFVRPLLTQIETVFKVSMGVIKVAIDLLGGDWKGAVENMKKIWDDIVGGFEKTFITAKDQVLVAVGLLEAGFKGIAGNIQGAFTAAINEIIGLVNKAIDAYNKIPLAPNVPNVPTIGGGGSSGGSVGLDPAVANFGSGTTQIGPMPPIEGPMQPGGGGGGFSSSSESQRRAAFLQYIGGGQMGPGPEFTWTKDAEGRDSYNGPAVGTTIGSGSTQLTYMGNGTWAQGSPAANGITVNVTVQGSVLTENELVRTIENALLDPAKAQQYGVVVN